MNRYAENTSVSTEASRAEIERTLTRYGATSFAYATNNRLAQIQFEASGRRVRFILPLPDPQSTEFIQTAVRNKKRSPDEAFRAWEQACRQKWRALALAIKAKLEAVQSGITTFESEFMAHIVLPNGRTVAQEVGPGIETAYKTGKMAPLLEWTGK